MVSGKGEGNDSKVSTSDESDAPQEKGNSAGRLVLELVHRLIARTSHPTPFERHSDSVYVVTQSYLLKSVQLLFPDIVKYSTQ